MNLDEGSRGPVESQTARLRALHKRAILTLLAGHAIPTPGALNRGFGPKGMICIIHILYTI